jgi:hypothetical protein
VRKGLLHEDGGGRWAVVIYQAEHIGVERQPTEANRSPSGRTRRRLSCFPSTITPTKRTSHCPAYLNRSLAGPAALSSWHRCLDLPFVSTEERPSSVAGRGVVCDGGTYDDTTIYRRCSSTNMLIIVWQCCERNRRGLSPHPGERPSLLLADACARRCLVSRHVNVKPSWLRMRLCSITSLSDPPAVAFHASVVPSQALVSMHFRRAVARPRPAAR